jgi:hypothetical protein
MLKRHYKGLEIGLNICKLQMLSEMEASSSLYMSLYCNYHGSTITNIPCCYCACSHQEILELENQLKDAHIQHSKDKAIEEAKSKAALDYLCIESAEELRHILQLVAIRHKEQQDTILTIHVYVIGCYFVTYFPFLSYDLHCCQHGNKHYINDLLGLAKRLDLNLFLVGAMSIQYSL